MNSVQLMGNLTRDPEVVVTPNGTRITKFCIANNVRNKDKSKEKVNYVNCLAFNGRGEAIEKYFKKGSRILINGELSEDRWEKDGEKRSRLNVVVNSFNFLDGKKNDSNSEVDPPPSPSKVETDVPF